MKNIREEAARWIRIGGTIAIWLVLVWLVEGKVTVDVEALRLIPEVVFVYAIVRTLFARFMWRWTIFRGWLVPYPDLQGTWTGTLTSTWTDPATGKSPEPIPATLVLRQTFDHIAVTVHTAESTSTSTAASFDNQGEDQQLTVSYMYVNRPKPSVRDRSAAHDGAAVLHVVTGQTRRLEGEYWTARKTVGEISVRFRDRQLDGAFSSGAQD